ncbi:YegP family protein [Xenorhabdus sp. IM139775]|nr:YegP family protein [Xenorhabdus sp. IM139775]MDC9592274.1 YegP family protein [Xenorhabdus sp. IM139775]
MKARNHQVIAISEAHANEANMKKCMQSVMKTGPTEKVRDLTKQN